MPLCASVLPGLESLWVGCVWRNVDHNVLSSCHVFANDNR
jgi:hypothetical protein